MTLVPGNIRFMRIFAGIPREKGCRKRQFSVLLSLIILFGDRINDLWMTVKGVYALFQHAYLFGAHHENLNEGRPTLSAAKISPI